MVDVTDSSSRASAEPRLPTGPVTFLITDIEGSTRLLIDLAVEYSALIEQHNEIMRRLVAAGGGVVVSTAGDSVFAVFLDPGKAVASVAAIQRELAAAAWPGARQVKVRIGLHTGVGVLGGDDYVGLDVHRTARISGSGHGGQVLLSAEARRAVGDRLPSGVQVRDLGEHSLKDLVQPEHLFQLVIAGLPSDFAAVREQRPGLTRLPTPRTSFVERPETQAVLDALDASRLVTLTGPGGTGKTRLAVQVGLQQRADYSDGVVFVDLSSVIDPDLVASAIADALTVPPGTAPPADRIAAWLAVHQSMLLILDNFEQVLDAAPTVSALLDSAECLTLLVTSRSSLRISGETEVRIEPLGLPDPEALRADDAAPAVRLFAERAAAVDPSFRLDASTIGPVSQIVTLVDGLPLAVELAAARVSVLAVPEIAARLRSSGGLGLLGRGGRDAPRRHRALRHVIEWSHQLLEPDVQRAFRRLSVFSGGAEMEQIEQVLSSGDLDALDEVQTLVEHSLMARREDGGVARFAMLATIREFATERLDESGEADAVRRRHAEAFCDLAGRAQVELTGWSQKRWLDRLERDHDNLRAALDWAVASGRSRLALETSGALWRFWQIRGHLDEGRHRLDQALSLPGDHPIARATALEAAGGLDWWRGQMEAARDAYAQALALMAEHGTLAQRARARYNLALTYAYVGAAEDGIAGLERARDEARAAGDRSVEAWATWGLCDTLLTAGNVERSYPAAVEALEMFRELDDPLGIGWSDFMAANALFNRGRTGEARQRVLASMRLFAGFGDISALVLGLWALAQVEYEDGHHEHAVRLTGMSEGLSAISGTGIADVSANVAAQIGQTVAIAAARDVLGAERVDALLTEGAAYSADEALAFALALGDDD